MQPPLADSPLALNPTRPPQSPTPTQTIMVIELENPEDEERLYQIIELESETEIACYPSARQAEQKAFSHALVTQANVTFDHNVVFALWDEQRESAEIAQNPMF